MPLSVPLTVFVTSDLALKMNVSRVINKRSILRAHALCACCRIITFLLQPLLTITCHDGLYLTARPWGSLGISDVAIHIMHAHSPIGNVVALIDVILICWTFDLDILINYFEVSARSLSSLALTIKREVAL